jgi:UDP-glucose 4-epimerase
MIYASSIAVFEASGGFASAPLGDERPRTPYARAKAQGERMVEELFEEFVIVRPTNIFGPQQRRGRERVGESHVIPDLLHKIHSAERLEVLGDGRQVRNFIHVDDVAWFLVAALAAPARGWFNLRSDIQLSIGALATTLLRAVGQRRDIVYRPDYLRFEPHPIELFALDTALARGWRPLVRELTDGLGLSRRQPPSRPRAAMFRRNDQAQADLL